MHELHAEADILIVDDNPANVELLTDMLEDAGYRSVEGLTDPRDVMGRVRRQRPDLILLDVRMPHISGLDLLTALRPCYPEEGPPVIVLTAQTDASTRYRALELGARDFLTKPLDQHEVLRRIANVLALDQVLRIRKDRNAELEAVVQARTRELERLASQDPLTQLPNRRALLEVLDERLMAGNQTTCVAFMVIEGVEDLAAVHGFSVADDVLRLVAGRLRQWADDAHAEVGVWSGTHWLVVIDLPTGAKGGAEGMMSDLAEALLSRFREPFCPEGMTLHLGVRIGIALAPAGQTADQWVRQAALAVPRKENSWHVWSNDLDLQRQRQVRLRQALAGALEQHQMSLAFQPKVSCSSVQVKGVEALLRWEHPEYGRVSPAEFIPVAEASGEILRLGQWVIDEALATWQRWHNAGQVADDFSIAVNVAPGQLAEASFAQMLMEQVRSAGVPPGALELEVTESGLMVNRELAVAQLETLTRAGFRIAIDDFGTGYSSLSYLKTLPVHVLKIDRAFIRDLHFSAPDQRLTGTVLDLARHFGFQTVAEGVERLEHWEWLTRNGCSLVQGYLFSPPLSERALMAWMSQGPTAVLERLS